MGRFKDYPPVTGANPMMDAIVTMVQRVEFAALQEVHKRPGGEKIEACMVDPRGTEFPKDSFEWMVLFFRARQTDAALASLLYFIRGAGAVLVEDDRWGMRIQYIESMWDKPDELIPMVKKELLKYRGDLEYLLAEVRWPGGVNV